LRNFFYGIEGSESECAITALSLRTEQMRATMRRSTVASKLIDSREQSAFLLAQKHASSEAAPPCWLTNACEGVIYKS
jgi:hypothetical protein